MLYSVTEAVGNGGLTEVPVPPHLSRAHLTVYVDFVPTLNYEWLDDTKIRLPVATGKTVRVVRSTSPGQRMTDYVDGTVLGANTLDMDSLQAFYLAQEARDIAVLQGSAVGTPAPGTESTTAGLLALLTGQITVNQLVPSLVGTINLISGDSSLPGSVNSRLTAEQQARASAITAEAQARQSALLAEAQARQSAIAIEQQARQTLEASVAQQVTTLTAAVSGAVAAVENETLTRVSEDEALATQLSTVAASVDGAMGVIQAETLARVNADAALASQITTVQSTLGDELAEVREIAETATGGGNANANYTIKVTARSDGRFAVAGIGLNATAPEAGPAQSEIILAADQFFFVPSSAGLNAPPTPLLAAGLVDGVPTTVFNSGLWGDQAVEARVIVDGTIEARHVKTGTLTVDKLDTRGIEIKDAAGAVVFSAGVDLDWSRIKNVSIGSAQIADIIESTNYVPGVSGWRLNKNGVVEFQDIVARGDIRATSLTAESVTTENIVAGAVTNGVVATSTVSKSMSNLTGGGYSNGTWLTGTTAVITTTVDSVLRIDSTVTVSASWSGTTNDPVVTIHGRVMLNGVVIGGPFILGQAEESTGNISGTFALPTISIPCLPGTYEVSVQAMRNSSGAPAQKGKFLGSSVALLETKR